MTPDDKKNDSQGESPSTAIPDESPKIDADEASPDTEQLTQEQKIERSAAEGQEPEERYE
ncbi:MAG: hypothetical protein V4671_18405 [Armatimonadota bacterium]